MNTNRNKPKIQGKTSSHRDALVHSQVLELIRGERLKTTPTKGKLLKQKFDRLVTEAKKDTFASKRRVENYLRNEKAIVKFYGKILPRLQETNSGYILSAKTLPRKGDNAPQMICMIKGAQLTEKKSRLAAALQKQDGGKSTGRGGIFGRGGNSRSSGSGKKIDSTADTRRVAT